MSTTSTIKELLTRNLRESGIVVAFIAIVVLFSVLTDGTMLTPRNLTNIVLQYSYILVLAIGMVMVIIGGHIDLSVGSIAALAGATAAVIVIQNGLPWWLGVIAAIFVGILAGAWQGAWVAFVGIPAFIVTLAGLLLFRGMTLRVLDNISLSPFPSAYQKIATGFQNGLLGGPGYDVFTLVVFGLGVAAYVWTQLRARQSAQSYNHDVAPMAAFITKLVAIGAAVMWFGWQLAHDRGLPNVLIILGALVIIYSLVMRRTVFGRNVYAIGGNLKAAELSGVKTKWVSFGLMLNMGLLSGVAGVLYSSRTNGAQPSAGALFELDAIAAAFIGGAAVTGGVGKVTGAIVGGLIMAAMSNGMQLMGIDQSTQQIVKGIVLLLAVGFDVWNKKRSGT